MLTSLSRRGFLSGLIAAPAVVAASSLMPVSAAKLILPPMTIYTGDWVPVGECNLVVVPASMYWDLLDAADEVDGLFPSCLPDDPRRLRAMLNRMRDIEQRLINGQGPQPPL